MVRLLDKSRVSFLSFLYCFVMVLYAGMATKFQRGLGDITSIGNGIALVLTIIVILYERIRFTKQFWLVVGIFLFYGFLTSINNGRISPLWITKWPFLFLYAFVMCQSLKGKLLVTIEQVLFILCLIALGLWAIQVISPSTILSIVKRFEFSQPFSDEARIEANMLVFTLNSNYSYVSEWGFFPRNAGFAWEAGAFGSLVCLGLFCNMMRKDFSFKNNVPLFVFFAALFSTQSTTALMAFGVGVVIWLILRRKVKYAIILLPLVIWVLSMPFVYDKAMNEYGNSIGFSVNSVDSSQELSRLQSFSLSLYEFSQHPILGLGGDAGGSVLISKGVDSALFSGFGELLARYGIIITLLFFIALFKSCRQLNVDYNTRTAYSFVGILVAIMFGFNFWTQPVFICLWLYSFFGKSAQYYSQTQ